jgi:hypothetical protein
MKNIKWLHVILVTLIVTTCSLLARLLINKQISSPLTRVAASSRSNYHYTVDLYSPLPSDSPLITAQLATYNQKINKTDIVVLTTGDFTINAFTQTNGGDVIILANRVFINSPIDTRVYLDHSHPTIEGANGGCLSAADYLTAAQLQSFQDFYAISNDVWNDSNQAYIPGTATVFPEMPFSFTSCAPHGQTSGDLIHPSVQGRANSPALRARVEPGFPSFRINQGSVKSGDIIIYANDIQACATCLSPDYSWNGLKPERFDPAHPVVDRTYLNARGIRGGRGFVNFWGCQQGDIGCGPLGHPSGPGGPPVAAIGQAPRIDASSGGLPGYIELGFVNNHSRYADETNVTKPPTPASLAPRIGATPGQFGADQHLDENCRTTSNGSPLPIPGPNPGSRFVFSCAPSDGTRGWFLATPITTNDSSVSNSRIIELSPDSALFQVGVRLTAMGITRAYQFDDILLPAKNGVYINNLSPSDQYEAFLQQAVVDGDNAVLSAAASLGSATTQPSIQVEPAVLQGLSADRGLFPGFTPRQYQLIERLHTLTSIVANGDPTVDQYFRAAAGLALRSIEDPTKNIDFNTMLQELTGIQSSVDALAPILTGTSMLLFEHFTIQDAATLQAKVDALRSALDDAEKKANDSHDIFKQIPGVLQAVQKIITDGRDIYSDIYGASPETALTPAGDIVSGIDRIRQILNGSSVNPDDIRRLLADAQKAYDDFQAQATTFRQQLMSQQYANVSKVVNDRRTLNSQVMQNLLYFDDLLRGSIYEYRYNHQSAEFQRNIANISQTYVISGYPAGGLTTKPMPICGPGDMVVRLEDLNTGAARGVADCVSNDTATATPLELRVRQGSSDVTQPLPLVEYSTTSTPAVISLQGRYNVADLIVVPTPTTVSIPWR